MLSLAPELNAKAKPESTIGLLKSTHKMRKVQKSATKSSPVDVDEATTHSEMPLSLQKVSLRGHPRVAQGAPPCRFGGTPVPLNRHPHAAKATPPCPSRGTQVPPNRHPGAAKAKRPAGEGRGAALVELTTGYSAVFLRFSKA